MMAVKEKKVMDSGENKDKQIYVLKYSVEFN